MRDPGDSTCRGFGKADIFGNTNKFRTFRFSKAFDKVVNHLNVVIGGTVGLISSVGRAPLASRGSRV